MTAIPDVMRDRFASDTGFALVPALVMLGYVGSTSHNTYVPKDDPQVIDDIDYMGVVVPPPERTLGVHRFEHWTLQEGEHDAVIYSLDKYIRLLLKSNPNVLGTLWLREDDYILRSDVWRSIADNRRLFSTKAAYPAFSGYAYGQLKKMTAFDLQAQADWDRVNALLLEAGWTVEQVVTGAHREMPQHSIPEADLKWAVATCQKIHARHFQGYMGEKRKALVRKYGYDTKNAAHLIRLLKMCVEFLDSGALQVFRTTDAEMIREVKRGEWTLDQVQQFADSLFLDAKAAVVMSDLPERPDDVLASHLLVQWYKTAYGWTEA